MQEKLQTIRNLQLVENRRRAILEKKEAVPRDLESIKTQTSDEQERVAGLEAQVEEGQQERRKMEGEIESMKDKISRYREQLMTVKTNREYSALLHEIEEANGLIRKIEDRIIEAMEKEESAAKELQAGRDSLTTLEAELREKQGHADERMAEYDAELSEVNKERDALRSGLDREILSQFDKVIELRGGVAVVGVLGESCAGCRVRIRPQVLAEIRRHTSLHRCDNCKRILVYDEATVAPEPAGS